MMNEHFASSYTKRKRRRRARGRKRGKIPRCFLLFFFFFAVIKACSFWFSLSLWLLYCRHRVYFSFYHISILFFFFLLLFFPRYFELDINRQFSSVNRLIIDAEDHRWMITNRYQHNSNHFNEDLRDRTRQKPNRRQQEYQRNEKHRHVYI